MDEPKPRTQLDFSPQSLAFAESLYMAFLHDPTSVSAEWRRYFEQLNEKPPLKSAPSFRATSIFEPRQPANTSGTTAAVSAEIKPRFESASTPIIANARSRPGRIPALQHRVDALIRNYRVRGHMIAAIDPLGVPRARPPELDISFYHLSESDLDRQFTSDSGGRTETLGAILERMRNTYCRSIGVQFMHIDDLYVREWLQERMEGSQNRIELSRDEQLQILTRLTDAVILEEFIQKKFTGAKSFSLEGAESLIPLLAMAIEKAGEQGVESIVMGMAHRGRLNVLANVMGKTLREIFREFDDRERSVRFTGDVKYHLGHRTVWTTSTGHAIDLSLTFNPSHLEFVNPVAVGRVRAIQDRAGDVDRTRGLALLIHGDAAFAGEGVVQETLNLSELEAYTVGGTIHVVVNNQIGFTTDPSEGRSSTYSTDVAKMLQTPIFHVNGEDPEAVAQVVRLSLDFREMFQRDVVIDMYCYRRRGHNEADEAAFTQPLMVRTIEQRKNVREGYLEHLLKLGGVTREEADQIEVRRRELLEHELSLARQDENNPDLEMSGKVWQSYRGGLDSSTPDIDTAIDADRVRDLLERLTRLPAGFHAHPKIERFLEHRREMARGERPLDWSTAEALAFARIVTDGYRVRLSGQDSERGTYSQRHAVFHDTVTGEHYSPFLHLKPDQGPVHICNSPLSEIAVLGFEYGYSLDCPDGFVGWEAQFGDFWNAAQVVVDQFIASAEEKWRQLSGVTLLLPHGFEGMGPEHSSARMERFLLLAANDNMQCVSPSTPAQYFHVLCRQVIRPWRKPLIVMTPKSLLRHPAVVSDIQAFTHGKFQRVIADQDANSDRTDEVKRVLLCSGKIYYELLQKRTELHRGDIAIVRIEQLYPLSDAMLNSALRPFAAGTPVVWVQEEPENMGAWRFLKLHFGDKVFGRFPFSGVYRPASASPATGSARTHRFEQQRLIQEALTEARERTEAVH